MMMAHVKNAAGQRETRSVVGVQLNCVLPVRLADLGNNGDGLTILPASRMRLSQKISSAFVPPMGAGRGFFALLSGACRLPVLKPASLTSISETRVPTRHS